MLCLDQQMSAPPARRDDRFGPKQHPAPKPPALRLAALHVTANSLYGWLKKEPLITAMVTGEKPAAAYADETQATLVARPMLRALVCLAVAAGMVFGSIAAVGGRF